ncbi:MAG: hypothetical protein ACI8PZ_004225 [Myxococcota bacterium]|jgi:hypothetical protein
MRPWMLIPTLALAACVKVPAADPEFSDAVRFLFRAFDDDPATVAFAIRELEAQVYQSMDVSAKSVNDRALLPERLTTEDVAGLDRPNRPVGDALPVAVAGLSPFSPKEHTPIHLLVDHTPVEPYSPKYYEREFVEGRNCWADRDCDYLRTRNDLTKENALMTVDYWFNKDYRWIDLNLPDPSELAEGEEAVNDGKPRWAFMARAVNAESFSGRKDNAWIYQSFSIDIWVPRDGEGYIAGKKAEFESDSSGGGSLRMLCLWAETEFGLKVSDDVVIGTTRGGIDNNFQAADDWLAEN